MASLGELYAELALKTDKLEKGVELSNRELAKLEGDIEKTTKAINNKLKAIGTVLSASVTLPLTLFGKAAVDTFSSFEQAMQNTYSVMGATASEMEALREKAEVMGAETRFSASDAADALYMLGQSGQSATQAMSSLDGVLQLAGATGTDLAFTSGTIASTLSQFNLTADKSAHIADVFAVAMNKSQANMTKLAYSMKYVGPVASGLNVSLETATATLMQLYNTGFGGEQAGTILRAALQKLASGTDELKEKLKKYGLAYDDVNPRVNNLADIMDRLKEANIDVAKANDIFGEAAAAGMSKLISGGGEAIRTMDDLLVASDGAALTMQNIQNTSFANTKDELSSAFEAVQITLTSNIIPVIDTLLKGVTNVLSWINELPVGIQVTATALAALAASAGPLLLVALSVKKIKAEMVKLNIVMSNNPIVGWAAAIGVAAAVAVGVIAQIKKSHEEAEKAAERYYKRARELADEAKAAQKTGNEIGGLLKAYEELHNKTEKTTEEQKKYNETLHKLNKLVPDIVLKQDDMGDAYLRNVEKAKKAQKEYYEMAKKSKKHALVNAEIAALDADVKIKKYQPEQTGLRAKAEKQLAEALEIKKDLVDAQLLLDKYNLAVKKGNRTSALDIMHKMQREYKDYSWLAGEKSPDKIYATIEKKFNKTNKEANKTKEKLDELDKKLGDSEELLTNLEKIRAEMDELEKHRKELDGGLGEKELTTRAKELQKLKKEWSDFLKDIPVKKADARALGSLFDVDEEKFKFLQNKIKELLEIPETEIKDGVFTSQTKELQEWINLMWAFKKEKGAIGSTKKATDDKIIDNSYKAQIEALDKEYDEKIKKADEFGKDRLAIENEYQAERQALIDGFIDEEVKKEKAKNKTLSDEQAKANALLVETKKATKDEKGSGITLGDEAEKTRLMGTGFDLYLERQIKQFEEWKQELKDVQDMAEKLQELMKLDPDSANMDVYKQFLDDLNAQADELQLKLNPKYVTDKKLNSSISSLKENNLSPIKKQWAEINKQKDKYLKDIEESKNRGTGDFKGVTDSKEIAKTEAKLKGEVEKFAVNAKTAIAGGIIDGVLSVANSVTDIMARAIEQGGLEGAEALSASGGLISQISGMLPGVAGLVTKAIGSVLSITGKLVGAFQNRAKKRTEEARAEAEQFNDEIKRQQEEARQRAYEISGEIAKNIAKNIGRNKVSVDEIFSSQALEMEKKRIDGVIDKVKDLKTEMTYTYQQKRTRKKEKWYDPLDWFHEEEAYYTTETANYTVGQLLEKYNDAINKGEYELAKKYQGLVKNAIEKGLKDAGVSSVNIDPISNYLGNLDNALAEYVKTRDMNKFKDALKNQLYEALVNKAVSTVISGRIAEVFDKVEKGAISYEDGLKKIETIGEEAGEFFDEMNERFGLTASIARQEWEQVGASITSALTQALGNSAYEADWDAFKKSFASEMKKAIVESAIETAGIKEKVNTIIKAIMDDGEITGDEVTNTIEKLKTMYDGLEYNMAEVAKITKALTGENAIEMKASGTIIQNLSGADRDWFTEVFRDGFSKINQVIDLKETTIQSLMATQLIINSFTFNSYDGRVYIQADENTDLKGLITEIVREVVA